MLPGYNGKVVGHKQKVNWHEAVSQRIVLIIIRQECSWKIGGIGVVGTCRLMGVGSTKKSCLKMKYGCSRQRDGSTERYIYIWMKEGL